MLNKRLKMGLKGRGVPHMTYFWILEPPIMQADWVLEILNNKRKTG